MISYLYNNTELVLTELCVTNDLYDAIKEKEIYVGISSSR